MSNKKIKEMSHEELRAYHRDRYEARQTKSLHLTIHNCTPELEFAIISAIKEGK